MNSRHIINNQLDRKTWNKVSLIKKKKKTFITQYNFTRVNVKTTQHK